MKVMVTGAGGFLGSWMVQAQGRLGHEVVATDLLSREPAAISKRLGVVPIDLDVRDPIAVSGIVRRERPDVIYHFAGLAFVVPSWSDPAGTFATNLGGTLNLLEALRKWSPATRFAFAGSGTEYGDPDLLPTPETSPLKPTSPYASSKAAADLLCYQYYRSFEIPIFRYRIFGTTGPGKVGDSVNDFASQLVQAETGQAAKVIKIGNVDKERDVTDVRDAVVAMSRVVERGKPGEAYNIASGVSKKVRDTLDTLVRLSSTRISLAQDESKLRKVDEPVHLADVSKLKALGWSPTIPFEDTLRDVLDYWRGVFRGA